MSSLGLDSSDLTLNPTDWGMVDGAQEAGPNLNRLVEYYRRWIERQARRKFWADFASGHGDDWIQDFLIKMIQGRVVVHADQSRGSFRAFLVKCMTNHCIEMKRKERRIDKRVSSIPLEPGVEQLPDLATACAAQVLTDAARFAKSQCKGPKGSVLFSIIEDQFLNPIFQSTSPLPQSELMKKYGFNSKGVVSGQVRTARSIFSESINRAIRGYATSADEVEKERRDLLEAAPHIHELLAKKSSLVACLFSDMTCDLESFDVVNWFRIRSRQHEPNQPRTYVDLLQAEKPSVDLLELAKEFAKSILRQEKIAAFVGESRTDTPRFSREAAYLLYWLAIAVARTKTGYRISRKTNDAVCRALESCKSHIPDHEMTLHMLVDQQLDALNELTK